MKTRFLAAVVVVVALGGAVASAQADPAVVQQETTVFVMGTSIAAGSATAERTPNGINISLHTSGLNAGHVVTVWAFAQTSGGALVKLTRLAGHVIGDDGEGSYAGRVDQTELGALTPYGARIQLLLQDHGLLDPALMPDQLFVNGVCNGGCSIVRKAIFSAP